MSNKVYDRLKFIALVALPAIATLWLTIAQIWGLPYGEQIGATITAIDIALGAFLGVSASNYKAASYWSECDDETAQAVDELTDEEAEEAEEAEESDD